VQRGGFAHASCSRKKKKKTHGGSKAPNTKFKKRLIPVPERDRNRGGRAMQAGEPRQELTNFALGKGTKKKRIIICST